MTTDYPDFQPGIPQGLTLFSDVVNADPASINNVPVPSWANSLVVTISDTVLANLPNIRLKVVGAVSGVQYLGAGVRPLVFPNSVLFIAPLVSSLDNAVNLTISGTGASVGNPCVVDASEVGYFDLPPLFGIVGGSAGVGGVSQANASPGAGATTLIIAAPGTSQQVRLHRAIGTAAFVLLDHVTGNQLGGKSAAQEPDNMNGQLCPNGIDVKNTSAGAGTFYVTYDLVSAKVVS